MAVKTRDKLTRIAHITIKIAIQSGPVNTAITASKLARAACPEGNECGSVLRYTAPQSPGGRRRRTVNLITMTTTARPRMAAIKNAAIGRRDGNNINEMNKPANQNQESPEWAKKVTSFHHGDSPWSIRTIFEILVSIASIFSNIIGSVVGGSPLNRARVYR